MGSDLRNVLQNKSVAFFFLVLDRAPTVVSL